MLPDKQIRRGNNGRVQSIHQDDVVDDDLRREHRHASNSETGGDVVLAVVLQGSGSFYRVSASGAGIKGLSKKGGLVCCRLKWLRMKIWAI